MKSSKYKQGRWIDRDDNKVLKELREAHARQQRKYAMQVFAWSVATLVALVLGLWLVFTFAGVHHGV